MAPMNASTSCRKAYTFRSRTMACCRVAPAMVATTTCERHAFVSGLRVQSAGLAPERKGGEKSPPLLLFQPERRGHGREPPAQCLISASALGRSIHLEQQRADMPCVADLGVIEGSNAHAHSSGDRRVERTSGIKSPRHFERPTAGGPARSAANVGAIAAVAAHDENARNERVERELRIRLRRIRNRLGLRHPPARAFALADVRIEIDPAHGGPGRLPAFGQWYRLHRPLIAARPALLEIVRIVRGAWVGSVASLVGTLPGDFSSRGLGWRSEMAIVDETQKTAPRRPPLPDVGVGAVHGVVQPATGEGGGLAISRRAA